jgi:hypothetical protein
MRGETRRALLTRVAWSVESGGPACETDIRVALSSAQWRQDQQARAAVDPPGESCALLVPLTPTRG